MTFDEYSQRAKITQQYGGTARECLTYTSIALSGEVGEYLNDYKKFLRTAVDEHSIPTGPLRDHMLEELGDALWYLNRSAAELNSSLIEVAQMNLAKLAARHGKKEE